MSPVLVIESDLTAAETLREHGRRVRPVKRTLRSRIFGGRS